MSELHRERLQEVRVWAEEEIERIAIRRANAPMFDNVRATTGELVTKTIPSVMAGPEVAIRESVLKLERSLHDPDQREAKAEEERQRRLARAKARTGALREWLEAIS